MTVDGRRLGMECAIGFALVRRMEMRPRRGAHRVSEVLRGIGEERIHRRFHRAALGADGFARRGDRRDQGRKLEAPQRRGLERARSRVRFRGRRALAERLSRDAETFPEMRRIRAQPAQLAQLLLESRDVAAALESGGVFEAKLDTVGCRLHRPREERELRLGRAGRAREHRQTVPCEGLARVEAEHSVIERLRVAQPLFGARAPCLVEEAGDSCGVRVDGMVGRTGFEPVTNGLKVRCSTS